MGKNRGENLLRIAPVKPSVQAGLLAAVMTVMANVDAVVDHFLHPEIPYFDAEHLAVGGVTAAVSGVLTFTALVYMNNFLRACEKIVTLEKFLPICSYCKKIRHPGMPPESPASWKGIEAYIEEKTSSQFTHGICPACMKVHFPEIEQQN